MNRRGFFASIAGLFGCRPTADPYAVETHIDFVVRPPMGIATYAQALRISRETLLRDLASANYTNS